MDDLRVTWEQVEECLAQIPGVRPAAFKAKFYAQRMFYGIRYAPGEVIMAKGMYSDFAGVLMSGQIRVLLDDEQPAPNETQVPDCWQRPGELFRRIENWVLQRTDRAVPTVADNKPAGEGTAAADTTARPPAGTKFARWIRNTRWFKRRHEDRRLAERKLAGPLEQSVHDEAWLRRLRETKTIIPARDDKGDFRPIFDRIMGVTGAMWNEPRGATLVADPDQGTDPCIMILMNRKALMEVDKASAEFRFDKDTKFVAQVLPNVLRTSRLFAGLDVQQVDFVELARCGPMPLQQFGKGDVILRQNHEADYLSLILNGTVRISRDLPGGASLVEHLNEHDYFGIACVLEGGRRSANAMAVTDVNVVTISKQVLLTELCGEHGGRIPGLETKLRAEWERLLKEDTAADALQISTRADPPEQLVPELMQARNLLRINMDLCTRCDQCVKACAEAHDGVPRFHRANPDLRFGKWEIAAACVHCINAPCQKNCPVGAITFLPDGMVQIHRSRCISCESCVDPCPFNVIEMIPATSPEEAPAASPKKGFAVATKCDLCLTRGEPPCVHACPYGAAERGAPDDLFPNLQRWLETTGLPSPEAGP